MAAAAAHRLWGLIMLVGLLQAAVPGDARRLEEVAAAAKAAVKQQAAPASARQQPAATPAKQQQQQGTALPKATAQAPLQPAVAAKAAAPAATALSVSARGGGGSWAPSMNLPAGFEDDAAAEAMLPAIDALVRELPHVQLLTKVSPGGAAPQHVRGMAPAMLVEDAAFNGF